MTHEVRITSSHAETPSPDSLVDELRANLARCHDLANAARGAAVAHGAATGASAAGVARADDPLVVLIDELARMRARLERSGLVLRAMRAAHAASAEDPPLLTPASDALPDAAPRGVDPLVWRALRVALATSATLTVELHRTPPCREAAVIFTARPLRIDAAAAGPARVVFANGPGTEHVVLASRIARATLAQAG